MYSVLVVDDEKLAREDIVYKVASSGFPFSWILEAGSAEEAFEIIKANRPDILLTDIMMGEKSGLDLLELAKPVHPEMVSLIICGYPEFKFAQRAVSLGVLDYLLKPVKPDDMNARLATATQEVRKRRTEGQISTNHYLLEKTVHKRTLQEAVNAFVTSGGRDGARTLNSFLSGSEQWFQMIIFHINAQGSDFAQSEEEKALLLYGVTNIAEELAGNWALIAASIEHDNTLMIIAKSDIIHQEKATEEISTSVRQLKRAVDRAYHLQITAAISGMHTALRPELFAEASLALDLRYALSGGESRGLIYYSDPKHKFLTDHKDEVFTLLKRFFTMRDARAANQLVLEILTVFKAHVVFGIRNAYTRIIHALSTSCFKNGIGILPFLGYENINGSILNTFANLEEMIAYLQHIIEVCLSDEPAHAATQTNVLAQVKQYIDETFADHELSTNKLSKLFCVSLGYLSASFKKEFNITISKYIISKRIQCAENLLDKTKLSIGEVAENSGFNNLSYFMRLFKHYHDMTPSQFRLREKNAG